MSDFTISRLKQINDAAGASMPEIEGRVAREPLDFKQWAVPYLPYEPGVGWPMAHRRRTQEAASVLIGGSESIVLNWEPHPSAGGTSFGSAHGRAARWTPVWSSSRSARIDPRAATAFPGDPTPPGTDASPVLSSKR